MVFTPTQPHQTTPTWGHACGLFSLQLAGGMVASAISRAAQLDTEIYINILMTVLFSAFYVLLAEKNVVGALSERSYRRLLALKASALLSLFGVAGTILYSGRGAVMSERVGSFAVLLALAVLVSLVCAWVGLEIGARLSKRAQGR